MNKTLFVIALPLALLAGTGAMAAPSKATKADVEQSRPTADSRNTRTQVARNDQGTRLSDEEFARQLRRGLPPPQPKTLDPNMGAGTGTLGMSGGPGGASGPR